MPATLPLFLACVLFAASVQTLAGFGFSLVLMPLAVSLLGIKTAAPLVALIALSVSLVNSVRNRAWVDARELGLLTLAAAFGIPIGVWTLVNIDEQIVTAALGVVLILHGLYSLAQPGRLPLISGRWALPMGFIAGCLGGAYNVSGPPLVIYGSLRHWPTDRFRAILQAFFTLTYILTLGAHLAGGRITMPILTLYAWAVPAFGLGLVGGAALDRRLNTARLRLLVNLLIVALGVSLIL